MSLSAVAGILNAAGEVARVVVGPLEGMRFHVQPGEQLVIVPGLQVQEPVANGRAQADMVERVKRYAQSIKGGCGGCRQCCKTLYINEDGLHKASHTWCSNVCDAGCAIYDARPKPCRAFKCLWLKSQTTDAPIDADLRPDRCGVVLTADTAAAMGGIPDRDLIEVHVDRDTPDALARIAPFLAGKKTKLITHYYGEA